MPKKNEWLIHGLWPSNTNGHNPFYCNNHRFNESELAPILPDLSAKWLDIKKGEYSYEFWRYQWKKHGTCAVDVESTNSEFKYFKKALELSNKFNIRKILEQSQIKPGQKANIHSYIEAVRGVTGKYGLITCFYDRVSMHKLLFNNIHDKLFLYIVFQVNLLLKFFMSTP